MKILVYGFYHSQNLGDDLFMEALTHLFPSYQLSFVNYIRASDLQDIDGIFIGGGSLLEKPLNLDDRSLFTLIKQHKIFYVGVGSETNIDPMHIELMRDAKLIALRSYLKLFQIRDLNPNTIAIDDLVYCLSPQLLPKQPNRIIFITNISVVPQWNDQRWKHSAWNYFKSECMQFLDSLIEKDYIVDFFPMSSNPKLNDINAAVELMNASRYSDQYSICAETGNLSYLTSFISKYGLVISQRYHGIVLAKMSQVPYITIHHHDKLKQLFGPNVSYYGLNKSQLIEQHYTASQTKTSSISYSFNDLVLRVNNALFGN